MPEKEQKPASDWYYYALAVRIATDLLVTIAVPALFAAWLGIKLDSMWGTKPLMVIVLLAASAVITAMIVRKKANRYAKMYDKDR